MAKRGFLRRILDAVFRPERRQAPTPPPTGTTPGSEGPRLNLGSLRQQAAANIINSVPYANADRVRRNVRNMSRGELEWTVKASRGQIQAQAALDADRTARLPTGNIIPLNPWWYH